MRLMRILCACFRMDVELLELSADDLHLRIKPYFPDSYQAIRDMHEPGEHTHQLLLDMYGYKR